MSAKLLQLCLTLCDPWTVAHQAPLSILFSRQEYWSGLPCRPLGNLPNPGIELVSLMSSALAGGFLMTSATQEAPPLAVTEPKKGASQGISVQVGCGLT